MGKGTTMEVRDYGFESVACTMECGPGGYDVCGDWDRCGTGCTLNAERERVNKMCAEEERRDYPNDYGYRYDRGDRYFKEKGEEEGFDYVKACIERFCEDRKQGNRFGDSKEYTNEINK